MLPNRTAAAVLGTAAPRVGASYARKSDRDQEGLDSQHEGNASAAARDDYGVPSEYQFGDDDTSGVTTTRGGLDRLMALVESGRAPFDRVYIKN
ncbi:MAG TPA: recombinase family protein, partial [Gemmatirosa sp.]